MALVAIVLVLCAVFVPTVFITGLSGEFYKQFAVTIATATIISLILSLTLSPAMAALMLKRHAPAWGREPAGVAMCSARGATASTTASSGWAIGYARLTPRLVAHAAADDGHLCGPDRADGARCSGRRRSASCRCRTRAISLALVQLPPGSSLQRTDAVVRKVAARTLKIDGRRPGRGDVCRVGRAFLHTLAPNAGRRLSSRSSPSMSATPSWAHASTSDHGRNRARRPPTSPRRMPAGRAAAASSRASAAARRLSHDARRTAPAMVMPRWARRR